MSGVKSGTVKRMLAKTVDLIHRRVADIADEVGRQMQFGVEEFKMSQCQAQDKYAKLHRTLPGELQTYLEGETVQWERLMTEYESQFRNVDAQARAVSKEETRILAKVTDVRNSLNGIRELAKKQESYIEVMESYRGTDKYEKEQQEANELERRAQSLFKDMSSEIEELHEIARERRSVFVLYNETTGLASAVESEYERLVELARNRQEQERRIQEERRRMAMNLQSDLFSLRKSIEAKNYVKFGKDLYTESVRHELDAVVNQIEGGDFEHSIPVARTLKNRLGEIGEQIDAAQRRWEAAKALAEKTQADACLEADTYDQDMMMRFGADLVRRGNALELAFGLLRDEVTDLIQQERFDEAVKNANLALDTLRTWRDEAEENRRLHGQREEIAQAIMQALYDSNYDTPSYYLQDEGNELSDMCVVAASPTEVGNMKMRIDLSGKVSFEVENVPDGQEAICVEKVHQLQERLAEEGMDFQMTDWGRAENQNHEHLDVSQSRTVAVQRQRMAQRQG